jgi:hypothetical protein
MIQSKILYGTDMTGWSGAARVYQHFKTVLIYGLGPSGCVKTLPTPSFRYLAENKKSNSDMCSTEKNEEKAKKQSKKREKA